MKFTMTVDMDNAAFDQPATELAAILKDTRKKVKDGQASGPCVEHNGNTVGRWEVTGD